MNIYDESQIPEHLKQYFEPVEWGSEPTMQQYITRMVQLFRAIREALRDDGTVWLNLGDGYAGGGRGNGGKNEHGLESRTGPAPIPDGLKAKDLLGIPWRVALALQADEWYLRSDIIWHKPNPMPESVTDRPTKAHEYIFLLSKSAQYYYDADAIRENHKRVWDEKNIGKNNGWATGEKEGKVLGRKTNPNCGIVNLLPNPSGRNKRTVWEVAPAPFPGAHFAVFPEKLITPCVLAGAPKGGLVYDPFMGAGTTALVAKINGRNFIGSEMNAEYIELANARLDGTIKRYVAHKESKPLEDLPLFAQVKDKAT